MKLVFLILGFLLSFNFSNAAEIGVTDTEVIIGGHTSESGKYNQSSSVPRAAEAYFNQINEKGGINGRKIKYLRIDTQGEFVKAVPAAKKLVEEDKIFAFFMGMGPTHKPVYRYLMEKGVPDFTFTDNQLEYSAKPLKGVFPGTPTLAAEGRAFGELTVKKYKGKKACFLVWDDSLGEEFYIGAKNVIEEANKTLKDPEKVKVGAIERVNRGAAQANTQVLNLKKNNCDIVMTATAQALAPSSVSYAYSQDFKPVWMLMSWNASAKFTALLPEGSRNGIVSNAWIAPSENFNVPGWKDFKALMEKSDIPMARAEVGYSAAEVMTEVLKRAGKNLTRESFNKAAESLKDWKCSLCLMPISLSPQDHLTFHSTMLIVSDNDKWVPLK